MASRWSLRAGPTLGVCLAIALSGSLLLGPSAGAAPSPSAPLDSIHMRVSDADACLDDQEVEFLAEINDYRAASGVKPLSVSASLSSAAAYHSIDMAANGYLDHTLSDGTGVQQNMANFGYQGGTWGENIAAGMATAPEALQIWQNSPEHSANMLNGAFGAIGIGRAYDASSPHGWYWTTIFGDVSDGPGWLCGQVAPTSKSLSLFQSVDSGVTQGDVNLRSGPGESYDLVATLPSDTPMTITGQAQDGYLPVKVDGTFGWVGQEWVQRGAVAMPQTAAPSEAGTATAISPVELRSGPDTTGGLLSTIPAVAVVTLTGNAQNGFLEVSYDGQQGWADAAYLQVADNSSGTSLLQPAAPTDDQSAASAAAPAQPPASTIGQLAVTTTNVNLRSQPSATAVVLDIVPAGSTVSLTGSKANGYVNVRVDGQAGWIDEAYLQ